MPMCSFALTLRDGVKPRDVPVTIQGNFTKLTVQDVGAGQKLENAQLGFTDRRRRDDRQGRRALPRRSGHHRCAQGSRATLSRRSSSRSRSMTPRERSSGCVPARPSRAPCRSRSRRHPTQGRAPAFDVEADLSRAAIDGFIPGWTKPAGRPGKLTFRVTPGDDQTRFSKINLSAAPGRRDGRACDRQGRRPRFRRSSTASRYRPGMICASRSVAGRQCLQDQRSEARRSIFGPSSRASCRARRPTRKTPISI